MQIVYNGLFKFWTQLVGDKSPKMKPSQVSVSMVIVNNYSDAFQSRPVSGTLIQARNIPNSQTFPPIFSIPLDGY